MSWHYSVGQEAGFSLQSYLDGIRSQRSRSSSIPGTPCCNDSETGCSNRSQSGTMCEHSTASRGEDSLMLFQEDSRAKTSVQRVKVQDLPETVVDFGLNICESLMRFGLDLSSPKTRRTCVPVDLAPSSKDLSRWGMVFDGACWELGTSARLISETECGSWPTPTATGGRSQGQLALMRKKVDAGEITRAEAEAMVGGNLAPPSSGVSWPTPTKEHFPTPQASDHITKRTSESWKEQGRVNFTLSNPEIQKMWPTPKAPQAGMSAKTSGRPVEKSTHLQTQVALAEGLIDPQTGRMWPTPQASDNRDRGNLSTPAIQRRIEKGKQINLSMSVSHESGRLNPDWVEWLMAWPIGWTGSKPLEMDKFREWQRQHSTY